MKKYVLSLSLALAFLLLFSSAAYAGELSPALGAKIPQQAGDTVPALADKAVYDADTCKLTLDANGGYFENDPNFTVLETWVSKGSPCYDVENNPTNPNPHLAFNGWYYDAACTELAVSPNASFTPTDDATLYAGWTEGWIVTFDANGGEGAPAAQTKASGEAMLLSWEAPRREGFYFLGWSEDPNADKATYLPGESFTEDADTMLYALWGNPDFVLPETLTQIGQEAFTDTAARFVKLPDSTELVGPRAFAACTELDYIVIPDYLYQIDFSAFEGTQDVIVLTFSQFGRLYRLADYMRMMAP